MSDHKPSKGRKPVKPMSDERLKELRWLDHEASIDFARKNIGLMHAAVSDGVAEIDRLRADNKLLHEAIRAADNLRERFVLDEDADMDALVDYDEARRKVGGQPT